MGFGVSRVWINIERCWYANKGRTANTGFGREHNRLLLKHTKFVTLADCYVDSGDPFYAIQTVPLSLINEAKPKIISKK